jgi:hypothetical protein
MKNMKANRSTKKYAQIRELIMKGKQDAYNTVHETKHDAAGNTTTLNDYGIYLNAYNRELKKLRAEKKATQLS